MAMTVREAPDFSPDLAPAAGAARHVTSLDGLRAFAVLAVMAVHAGVPGSSLGWLGVDFFFVLSGFLITTLLAGEFARHGRISLVKFWGRRFLRLMPAYWAYAGGLTLAMTAFHWGSLQPHGGWTPGGYIAALWLYFINYAPKGGIWEHQSLSLHLWSLAIEEQFYFVWPILCALALRLNRAAWLAWGLVVVVLLRQSLTRGGDFLIDSRGLGIILGCAVAISLHQARSPALRRWLGSAPWRMAVPVAIVLVVAVATFIGERGTGESSLRRVLLPVILPLFALLIAMMWYGPADRISAALSWRPLAYIGKISYGVYLYHMLCHYLTWDVITPGLESWPRWPKLGLRLIIYGALTLGISTLSYQFLERPFLRLKALLR